MITPLVPRVGVLGLCSPLEVGADRAPVVAAQLADLLRQAGGDVVLAEAVDTADRAAAAGRRLAAAQADAVLLAPTSWCEDYLVLDLVEECAAPLFFWPQPGMETGALCGTQQHTAALRQLGHRAYACTFGAVDDEDCRRVALDFLRAAALRARLRRARIGIAGHHLTGMTHTAANEFALKRAVGPRVVWLDLPALLAQAAAVPAADATARWREVCRCASSTDVSAAAGVDSVQLYNALRAAVTAHGLAALTVGCYPQLMGRVCLAASLLADEGVPLACEGDVHGAIGQYLLQLLTGQPPHNTAWHDPGDEQRVVFTHCGSGSFALAPARAAVRLASVRLMGQGVCALFPARPGPVTLVNLTPSADGYLCGLLEGEAEPTDMVFPGNPVRVRFAPPVKRLLAWVHETGLGHHWMIGYGHVGAAVRAWAGLAGPGLRLLEP